MTRTFAMLAGALACVLGATCARAQQYPKPTLQSVLFSGWTTGGRPVSPAAGLIGYNTSLSELEFWNGSAWVPITSTGAFGTMANQNATAVAITGGTASLSTLTSVNTTTVLAIKNGPAGATMMNVGGNALTIAPQTNIAFPGSTQTWGSGSLVNNIAPISQNATIAGTTTGAGAMFGIFMQQTDTSSNTGNGNGAFGIYDKLILNTGSIGNRGSGYFEVNDLGTSNTNPHDFTGLTGKCGMLATDTAGSGYNNCFGFNAVAHVGPSITTSQVVGAEIDTWSETGSVMVDRINTQLVDVKGGSLTSWGVQASRDDVDLSLNNQYAPGAGLGYKIGLEFGRAGGSFPVATDGTLVYGQGTGGAAWTVANGIDFDLGTATGNWFNFGGVITGTGAGTLSAVAFKAGATAGVTCAGAPTGSFAATNGIVTHC